MTARYSVDLVVGVPPDFACWTQMLAGDPLEPAELRNTVTRLAERIEPGETFAMFLVVAPCPEIPNGARLRLTL